VELSAIPDAGRAFAGWFGGGTAMIIAGDTSTSNAMLEVVGPVDLTAEFVIGISGFDILSFSSPAGVVTILWQDLGLLYTVEWTRDLLAPAWRAIDDGTAWPISGGQWSGPPPVDAPRIFFRIKAE